jgi:phage head maturation protease
MPKIGQGAGSMTKQTKFISLKQFKQIEDGSGGFEGYVTTFGELDDVGDIILRGAYQDTIPQFLKGGFNADSHGWKFGEQTGYPVAAQEDDTGLFSSARFHSTEPAQNARTVAAERMSAGLDVFTSIGYEPSSSPIFITPQDYATEIPKYSAPSLVEQNLAKASRFSEVRVLPKIHLYEWSLVSVPALSSAMLSGIKSADLPAGLTLEEHSHSVLAAVKEYADRETDLSALRTKEGRPISEARRTRIAKVVDALSQLDEIRDELRALLDETAPKDADEEASKQLAQEILLAIVRRDVARRGVQIT